MPLSALARPYAAMLFDIDGTLADSIPMIVAGLGDAFERFSGRRPSDDVIRSLIGRPLVDQLTLLGMPAGDEEDLRARIRYAMDRFEAHRDLCVLFDPAVEAWAMLADRGLPTALVTSKNREELDGFLDDFPTLRRADAHVSSSDTARPKPSPDPALEAAARLGADPRECLFVGDSVYDVQCAHAAGMPCLAVAYGASSAADLVGAGADAVLDTPEDLLDWVRRHVTTLCDARPTPI